MSTAASWFFCILSSHPEDFNLFLLYKSWHWLPGTFSLMYKALHDLISATSLLSHSSCTSTCLLLPKHKSSLIRFYRFVEAPSPALQYLYSLSFSGRHPFRYSSGSPSPGSHMCLLTIYSQLSSPFRYIHPHSHKTVSFLKTRPGSLLTFQ